jgi:hypothetical protein
LQLTLNFIQEKSKCKHVQSIPQNDMQLIEWVELMHADANSAGIAGFMQELHPAFGGLNP